MAAETLALVDAWFVHHVFEPLEPGEPRKAIDEMWRSVDAYFRSGRRICLVGAFALGETRDRFAAAIRRFFAQWIAALQGALERAGVDPETACRLAQQTVAGIQGALVLARAFDDKNFFARALARLARTVGPGFSAAP